MDRAVQDFAQQQQTTPVRTDLAQAFDRMARNVQRFLATAKGRTAQPALFLQALNLYITYVEDLVGRRQTAQSPGDMNALKALIDYYNDAATAFNAITEGTPMDSRDVNNIFLSDVSTTRGIMNLAETLATSFTGFVSPELDTQLFARPDSLLDFIVKQWSRILVDFNNRQSYKLPAKSDYIADIINYP
jgi:hypothetical protein